MLSIVHLPKSTTLVLTCHPYPPSKPCHRDGIARNYLVTCPLHHDGTHWLSDLGRVGSPLRTTGPSCIGQPAGPSVAVNKETFNAIVIYMLNSGRLQSAVHTHIHASQDRGESIARPDAAAT